MGGSSPSRLSAEEDEGGMTFVKGIRLSDRVINRMKNSSKASCPHFSPDPQTQVANPVPAPSVEHLLHLQTPPSPQFIPTPPPTPTQEAVPTSPSVEAAPPVKLIPPPPVKFHSLPPPFLDSGAPPSAPSSRAENPEVPESLTPPSALEPIVLPPPESFIPLHKEPETLTAPQMEQVTEPVVLPPNLSCEFVKPAEPAAVEPLESSASSLSQTQTVQISTSVKCLPVKPVISPSPLPSASAKPGAPPLETEATPVVEEVHLSPPPSLPEPSLDEASLSCQHEELTVAHTPPELEAPPPKEPGPIAAEPPVTTFLPPVEDEEPSTIPSPAEGLPFSPEVMEEDLRQKIRAEMQKSLEEEINQKRQELQQQLEEMQALSRAEAKAAAQALVEEQVKQTLEAERAMYMEKLTESMAREKMIAEDEKLMVQLYAHQLEEKEKEMKKRNELYKEHVSKLEAKCAEFYKVSAENFQKGKEETHKRFARFNIQPLCGDLQGQILKCYKENPGRTLTCSGIASAYMQCVDNAKKDKLTTGG
ncbi:coiled-coil-helix-coiled-coil-helix domain containing 3b isoform 2-T2 [Anableps anableps]